MRTERLFNIVSILLSKDVVSAKELAERFEVSQRTIYRDIDILSVAGVPVYMKKGRGGGISLMEGYKLDKTMLGDEDIESIMMSVGALGATGLKGVDKVISKLSAVFLNHRADDWIDIDFTEWDTNKNIDNSFDKLKSAILGRKLIKVSYLSSYGQNTYRTLAPLKLTFKARSWYALAYDTNKSDVRVFKISRMRDIIITDTGFNRDEYIKLKPKTNDQTKHFETVKLVMRFKPEAAYLLYDWYRQDDIKIQEDGSYLVDAIFPMDEWVYTHILSYGDKAEVLEPLFVREEIKKRVSNLTKKYKI